MLHRFAQLVILETASTSPLLVSLGSIPFVAAHANEMDDSFEDFGLTRRSNSDNNNNNEFVVAQEKLISCESGVRRVLQLGLKSWIDEKEEDPFAGVTRVVLIVPGNPGEILFYKLFMERLHQELGLPVIGATHVGLSRRCHKRAAGPLTVRRLVDDMISFLEEFVPESVEIILIGHSIGAYIAKDMMQISENRGRFVHCIMMCPALEQLGSSAGSYMIRVFQYLPVILYFYVALLWLLPDQYLRLLLHTIYNLLFDYPDCSVTATVELASVPSIRNALVLGDDEFKQVQDLDKKFIEKNQSRLSFVYADVDEWVPRACFENLTHTFPEVDAVVVPKSIHGFTFSKRMTEDFLRIICKTLEKFKNVEEEDMFD